MSDASNWRCRVAHVDFKMFVKLIAQNEMVCHAQARRLHWMICAIVDFLKLACDCHHFILCYFGKEPKVSKAHALS